MAVPTRLQVRAAQQSRPVNGLPRNRTYYFDDASTRLIEQNSESRPRSTPSLETTYTMSLSLSFEKALSSTSIHAPGALEIGLFQQS